MQENTAAIKFGELEAKIIFPPFIMAIIIIIIIFLLQYSIINLHHWYRHLHCDFF